MGCLSTSNTTSPAFRPAVVGGRPGDDACDFAGADLADADAGIHSTLLRRASSFWMARGVTRKVGFLAVAQNAKIKRAPVGDA